jgi:ribonuclease G
MPGSDHVGVSRKIEDKEERARLRALAREILPEKAGGVIVRTVGEELTRETFEREMRSLMTTWKNIQKKAARGRAPAPCTARRS